MEAKDTVMPRVQVNKTWKDMGQSSEIPAFANYGPGHPTYKLLKAQAEISFGAGYRENEKHEGWCREVEYKRGLKEVVEWFYSNGYSGGSIKYTEGTKARFDPDWKKLQNKLKEWGIEPGTIGGEK